MNKKLKLSSNNFELSIYLHEEKKNSFFRKLTLKTFEHLGYIKNYNFGGVLNNGKVKQSSDRIHYFFNMLSFTINTYLETLSVEDIESLRYLHFNTGNRIDTKMFYTDFSTYRRLTTEQKKFTVLIKEDKKKIFCLKLCIKDLKQTCYQN